MVIAALLLPKVSLATHHTPVKPTTTSLRAPEDGWAPLGHLGGTEAMGKEEAKKTTGHVGHNDAEAGSSPAQDHVSRDGLLRSKSINPTYR